MPRRETPRAPAFRFRVWYTACADDNDFIYHLRAMKQAWIAVTVAGMLWTAVQGRASGGSQEPPAGAAQGRGAAPQRGTPPPGRQGGGQRANFPQQQRAPGDPAVIAR